MPRMISEQKRGDIRDAITAGMTVTDIKDLLNTSAGTISKVKRSMGLPVHPRNRSRTGKAVLVAAQAKKRKEEQEAGYLKTVQAAQAQQATIMHHREIPKVLGVEAAPEGKSTDTMMWDLFGDDWQPPTYTPQEYFEAIAEGLRSRDTENNTLRRQIMQLEVDKQRLLSDLTQCKLQMANWSGPTTLPSRSLGNGG
jgi:hypothetical protein